MKKIYHRGSMGKYIYPIWGNLLCDYLDTKFKGKRVSIQLYDDYFNEDFVCNEYIYYPLGVQFSNKRPLIHWIRWKGNPQTYKNDCWITTCIEDANEVVPDEFVKIMSSRKFWFDRSRSFSFAYFDEWQGIFAPKGTKQEYSSEKHIEMQLLDDIGEQLTDFIFDIYPDKNIIEKYYCFSLLSTSLNSPIFNKKANKWIFPILFGSKSSYSMSIFVESDDRIRGSVLSQKIEVCKSIDKEIADVAFSRYSPSFIPPDPKQYQDYIKQRIIDYLNQEFAPKYQPYNIQVQNLLYWPGFEHLK